MLVPATAEDLKKHGQITITPKTEDVKSEETKEEENEEEQKATISSEVQENGK